LAGDKWGERSAENAATPFSLTDAASRPQRERPPKQLAPNSAPYLATYAVEAFAIDVTCFIMRAT